MKPKGPLRLYCGVNKVENADQLVALLSTHLIACQNMAAAVEQQSVVL